MSVPVLPLNKRGVFEYSGFDISSVFVVANNSPTLPLPLVDISTSQPASDVYDYSFWTEAYITLSNGGLNGSFLNFQVPPYENNVIQIWFSMYCGAGEPRGVGIGVRWYDEDGNILLSEGTYQKYPRQDNSYIQFITKPPPGAVEGRTIWGQSGLPGVLGVQWGIVRSSYLRQITSWIS